MAKPLTFEVAYGPLVDVCKAHGISRAKAFNYAREGLLETFLIGNRRYVYVKSVHTLPERLGVARCQSPKDLE